MTEKLYYKDSHMFNFTARVEACVKKDDYYEVVLDRTAFFPEGGGQSADTGILGGVRVLDVREENGIIYHKTDCPLRTGDTVTGDINRDERLSKMQQHSGEHIVSGIVHALYGFDNVGFHMGKDAVTMDYNGVLTPDDLKDIEDKANKAVYADIETKTIFPSEDELKNISYRSKKELADNIRIVVIPGYDSCACCAPHVKRTGEIGIIKLTGMQHYKGGVRVSMLCGFRALCDYREKAGNSKRISVALSAKENEIADEVNALFCLAERQKTEISRLKKRITGLKADTAINSLKASGQAGNGLVIIFDDEPENDAPREMANILLERGANVAAVFAGNDGEGYRYVIGSKSEDTRRFSAMLKEKFGARGGGKPDMVQGTVTADRLVIEEALRTCI